jgi:hypothetical protein
LFGPIAAELIPGELTDAWVSDGAAGVTEKEEGGSLNENDRLAGTGGDPGDLFGDTPVWSCSERIDITGAADLDVVAVNRIVRRRDRHR